MTLQLLFTWPSWYSSTARMAISVLQLLRRGRRKVAGQVGDRQPGHMGNSPDDGQQTPQHPKQDEGFGQVAPPADVHVPSASA